jgi:hypothetical protein
MTAQRAIDSLDPTLRAFLRPGELYVSDVPGVEVVVDGVDPRALLLLDSLPPRDEEAPTARLFVYQRNVERVTGSVAMIEAELRTALERELTATFLDVDRPPGDKRTLN